MSTVYGIEEMRADRARLYENMKKVNDAALAEKRDLTAEEAQEYDRLEEQFDTLTRAIDRDEKLRGMAPIQRQAPPPVEQDGELHGVTDKDGQPVRQVRARGIEGEEYARAYETLLRNRGNLGNLDAETRAALQVGTDSEGGYTVPDAFFRELVEAEREFGVMRQLARSITTGDNGDVLVPTVATRATAAWTAEEAAFTQSEPTFGQKVLQSFKAAAISQVSDELLLDSAFDIMGFIARDLGEAIGILENAAFVNGTDGSTTTPEGIMDSATTGKTFASNAAITADELIDLYHSIIDPYRGRAVWLMKDSTAVLLRKLKDGNSQYLWQPGIQAGQPDVLLGRPVYIDPDVPAVATVANSVGFGDIGRAYWIRDVQGITVKVLQELYAANGQVGYRVHRRTDGDLVDTAAFKVGTHPV